MKAIIKFINTPSHVWFRVQHGIKIALLFVAIQGYSSQVIADTFATYETGKDGIVLMTDKCPGDSSGTLKWVVSKFGGNVREGCYLINNRNNPVVKWENGVMQELDGSLFHLAPSKQIVKKELVLPTTTFLRINIKNEIDLQDGTYLVKEQGGQGRYALITHSHGLFEGSEIFDAICSNEFIVSKLPQKFQKIQQILKASDFVLTKCEEGS